MRIRRATVDDIGALCNIYENDGIKHNRSLQDYPLMNMLMDDTNSFFVALSPLPIGFVQIRTKGEEAKVDFLSVVAASKGKNVENKLLDTAEKETPASKISMYIPKSDTKMLETLMGRGYRFFNEVANLFGEGENGAYLIKRKMPEALVKPKLKRTRRKKKAKEAAADGRVNMDILKENLKKLEETL